MKTDLTALFRSAFEWAGLDIRRLPSAGIEDYVRLYGEEAVKQRRFYNVGAGGFRHPCWTNVDYPSAWYGGVQRVFLEHDLIAGGPLPIADGTAEIIYSSHTIEHIPTEAGRALFRSAARALRPGGIIRLTCPDADLDLAALRRVDDDWFYWDRRPIPIEQKWLFQVASELATHDDTPVEKLSDAEVREIAERDNGLDELSARVQYRCDRPGNHVAWWTGDKLIGALQEAGFDAYRSGFGQSAAPVLRNTRYFDNTHPQMSLYVEGVRRGE